MQGPRITWDNLVEGSGPIQFIAPTELFNSAQARTDPAAQTSSPARPAKISAESTPSTPPKQVAIMTFGKYRNRQMSEVQEMDPGYWRWLIENVGGFKKKARAAGLLDDE